MSDLTSAELARYSRHLLLPELGAAGQARLKAARVLVLGAGGLGSPAALYLAAAGVGTLGIADFDRVEAHNLQRQLLHDDRTVGQSKTASAAARLRATNPHITVVPHEGRVTVANVLALFAGYDVIVDGTDNFPTRYLASDAAVLARRPLVYGSIHQFEGQVAVFAPHLGGPCHRCLFPTPPAAGTVPNCAEAGVLGALCGIIGSLQALEALKLAAGFGTPLLGRLLLVDALGANFRTLTLAPDPACPTCGPGATLRDLRAENYDFTCAAPLVSSRKETIPEKCHAISDTISDGSDEEVPLEISVEETKRMLDTRPDGVLLVDVREPYELAICHVAGAAHIPMRAVPAHVDDLPREKHLLVLCHSGMRSMRVTEYLRAQGFPAVSNVGGGIAAWAEKIEPGMPRY